MTTYSAPLYSRNPDNRAIGIWLLVMAFLVFAMIVVGGATRLTESGLSMVDWKPVRGVIPPLNEAEWAEEFAAYQQYPEYKLVNRGMSLDAFKSIFWWEFSHRLLGRFIGIAFAVPFLFFWLRGRIAPKLKPKLVVLFLLGGSQGLLGWYMVKSGLVHEPDVSHYRLTAHLTLALVIFAALLWVSMDLLRSTAPVRDRALRRLSTGLITLVFIQLMLGGLVAGLNAGFAYNTWPLMAGKIIPDGLMDMSPWYMNFLESTLTVQFDHRILAYLIGALGLLLLVRTFRRDAPGYMKMASVYVFAAVAVQILLGILTLLYAVPVSLGTMHQAGGVLVLAATLYYAHRVRP